jgi:hypothetical protein
LWHQWDSSERPLKSLLTEFDPIDRELFFCSTTINIYNEKKHTILKSQMGPRNGPKRNSSKSLKKARFKKRLVQVELQNYNWIRSIGTISTPSLMNEYVMLFIMLASTSLNSQDDQIV